MARPKSGIVKGMGTGWEILLALVNEVLSLGGNDEHLRRILTSKTLRQQIAELIVGSVGKILIASREYFEEAGVKWMGDNFQAQFLDLEVSATEPSTLKVEKLEKDSLDTEILAKLGEKAEISIQEFKTFLAENRESLEGFIFYLRGKDGNLWAVNADWRVDGGGWFVRARSVTDPDRWIAGDRVVSRN